MRKKITWVLFTGIFALLPFILKVFLQISISEKIIFESYVGDGEMLAITSVLAIGIIGEMLFNKSFNEIKTHQGIAIMFLMLIVLFGSILYAIRILFDSETLKQFNLQASINMTFFMYIQISFYLMSLLLGFISKE